MAHRTARFARIATLTASLAGSVASAQTGGLEVIVTDEEHRPLPGAVVTIRHEQGYVKETAVQTNLEGTAEFPVLRATGASGKGYAVTVQLSGFAAQRLTASVRLGVTTRLPVQLSEELVERVSVEASSDVVDLDDSSQSMKFSDEFIDDLPIAGRFYQNALTMAPGVQDADGDGNPNVHGARDRDFKAVVSGISNVDPLTGRRMFEVNPNSIEEMEVITAGASLEFRRAQGGFARILQKQGSNDFEGVFELFYRSSALDGDGAGIYSDEPQPEFESYQPSFQVSGPIVKDKLWYRLSHDLVHDERPVNVTNGIVVTTDERTINSDQITWQASPRNKLAFQFQSDPRTITNYGVSSSVPAESSQAQDLGGEQYSLTWTAPYSPKILIESQVSWQDLNIGVRPSQPDAQPDCLVGPTILEGALCFESDSGRLSGPFPLIVDDHRQRLTVRGDATVFGGRLWGATHQLKFGMSVENERFFREQTRRPAVTLYVVNYSDGAGGEQQTPTPHAIISGEFPVPSTTQVTAAGIAWGLYVEDQIKPLKNLTLTAGLAIDREETTSYGNGTFTPEREYASFLDALARGIDDQQAFQQAFTAFENLESFVRDLAVELEMDYREVYSGLTTVAQQSGFWEKSRRADDIALVQTNLSPKLSIAWDPWNNGKTKLAASARRYYGTLPLAIPLLELEAPSASVTFAATQERGMWTIPPGIQGLAKSISPAVNVQAVSRNLETPHQDEFSLSFEREIATETSITLSYLHRKYAAELQDTDLNHVPLDAGRCNATSPSPGDRLPVIGPADGILDDCAGKLEYHPMDPADPNDDIRLEEPDGIPDLYIQNPGWGNVLLVGNLNEAEYDGFTFELERRHFRNWELQGSYTWSKVIGDGEDFNQSVGNDRTLIEDERGYQAHDQRHVVRVSATTVTPWGIRFGGSMSWQSGLPYSILQRQLSYDAIPPVFQGLGADGAARSRTTYVTGERNSERNVPWWDFNVKVTKEFRLGRGRNGQVSVEVFNLFNDGTYQVYRQVNGMNDATNRFGRQWQLGLSLAF